jgi:small subunit ribosomal protein S19
MAKKTQKRLPRRREEFTYRGFRLEDLRKMGMSELVPVMPSRVRRKITRGLTKGEENLLSRFRNGDAKIRTHLRDMVIMPEMIGKEVEIYNGKEYLKVEIQPEAVFHYLANLH